MDENGNYQVRGVTYRQTPQFDARGQVFNSTIVSFMVGVHGPFSIMFAPNQANPASVAAAITATVNQIREQDQLIAQLNASSH